MPPHELIAAVRVVAAGEALLAPSVTRRLIEEVLRSRPALPAVSPRLSGLTARERDVLVHVARGLSNAEIAAALVIAEQTVTTHIGRLLSKLGLRDRAQAIVFAHENGLAVPGSSGFPGSPG